jgi:septal ring factor EnvC (AmiA/AmiB activator)
MLPAVIPEEKPLTLSQRIRKEFKWYDMAILQEAANEIDSLNADVRAARWSREKLEAQITEHELANEVLRSEIRRLSKYVDVQAAGKKTK